MSLCLTKDLSIPSRHSYDPAPFLVFQNSMQFVLYRWSKLKLFNKSEKNTSSLLVKYKNPSIVKMFNNKMLAYDALDPHVSNKNNNNLN